MIQFDALFFDIDGTLVTASSLMPESYQKAFAIKGFDISIVPWRGSGMTDFQVTQTFLGDYDLTTEQKETLGLEICGIAEQIVIERVEKEVIETCPGIPELIAYLKEHDISFGLLTGNMANIVAPKLAKAGLDPKAFAYGGFGDHSPNRPETARRALRSAELYIGKKLDPQRALIIGDTPNDIICAHTVGAQVLAVATGDFSADALAQYHPEYLLNDLTDIPAFMEIIRPES